MGVRKGEREGKGKRRKEKGMGEGRGGKVEEGEDNYCCPKHTAVAAFGGVVYVWCLFTIMWVRSSM